MCYVITNKAKNFETSDSDGETKEQTDICLQIYTPHRYADGE